MYAEKNGSMDTTLREDTRRLSHDIPRYNNEKIGSHGSCGDGISSGDECTPLDRHFYYYK